MNKRQLSTMWVGIGLIVVMAFAVRGEEFLRFTTVVTLVTSGLIISIKYHNQTNEPKQ